MMSNLPDIPELSRQELRKFAFTMAAVIATVFGILIPWLFGFSWSPWPWLLAGLFVLWGLLAPAALNPVYKIWMRFGFTMHRVTTPLLLGLVFFLVLTPLGWIIRTFSRDSLGLKLGNQEGSYKTPSVDRAREDMEKPF